MFCPSCGEDLTRAPLRLGDRWCEYCGTLSSQRACLRALPRAVRSAGPMAEPPPKIVIRQDGEVLRLELSRNDEDETALFWVFIVVYGFSVGGLILSSDLWRTWLFPVIAALVLAVMSVGVVLKTWSRDVLSVDSRSLVVCRAMGRWRSGVRRIERARLRSVELVRLPNTLGRYRNLPGFVIRFRLDDGGCFDFGLGQGYAQLSHAVRWLREANQIG